VEQGQRRDPVQEEIERTQEEGSFHIQITHGKDQTEVKRSVHTQSTI
jgi:hypothetical protein